MLTNTLLIIIIVLLIVSTILILTTISKFNNSINLFISIFNTYKDTQLIPTLAHILNIINSNNWEIKNISKYLQKQNIEKDIEFKCINEDC